MLQDRRGAARSGNTGFHDDQHGTAIVLLAGLINAAKVVNKSLGDLRVVINGAGAAGTAIAKLIAGVGVEEASVEPVQDVLLCDSRGIISRDREDLNEEKEKLLTFSNANNVSGSLKDALNDADVFIGVSREPSNRDGHFNNGR